MSTGSNFATKYGPWALVTGASSGIGAELVKQIAAKGVSIVLVARRQENLNVIASELRNRFGVDAKTVTADLTTAEGVNDVIDNTSELDIGLLVNNAGREDSGEFLKTPLDQAINTLDLNTRAPLQLTHHFARKMSTRGTGGIIFMASIVAFQGVPHISNYAATKAYDLIFAESLAAELKQYGIDVLAAAPGFTKTELSPDFDFSGLPLKPMSPGAVAGQVVASLGNRRLVVPGLINKFLYYSGKFLMPRIANTFSFGRVFRLVLRRKLGQEARGASESVKGSIS